MTDARTPEEKAMTQEDLIKGIIDRRGNNPIWQALMENGGATWAKTGRDTQAANRLAWAGLVKYAGGDFVLTRKGYDLAKQDGADLPDFESI